MLKLIEQQRIQNPDRLIKYLVKDYLTKNIGANVSCMTYLMIKGRFNTSVNITVLSQDLSEDYQCPDEPIYLYTGEQVLLTIPAHLTEESRKNPMFTKIYLLVKNSYFYNSENMDKLTRVIYNKRINYNFITDKYEINNLF